MSERLDFILSAMRSGNMGANEYRVQNMPRCKVWHGANVGLAAATPTGVPFANVEYDTDNMAIDTATTALLKVKTPGIYQCWASCEYPQTGAAVYTRIIKNGNATLQIGQFANIASAGIDAVHTVGGLVPLNVGDQVSLLLFSTAATTIVTWGQYVLYLALCMVSTL